jgi:hypothetical protein
MPVCTSQGQIIRNGWQAGWQTNQLSSQDSFKQEYVAFVHIYSIPFTSVEVKEKKSQVHFKRNIKSRKYQLQTHVGSKIRTLQNSALFHLPSDSYVLKIVDLPTSQYKPFLHHIYFIK